MKLSTESKYMVADWLDITAVEGHKKSEDADHHQCKVFKKKKRQFSTVEMPREKMAEGLINLI